MHAILAHFSGPHWLLDDKDAKTYAAAINNVARHYEIRTAQKTIDWLNLLGMVCFVEGTRIVEGRRPKPPARSPVTGQIFQFHPPSTPPAPTPSASPQAEQKPPPVVPPSSGGADGPQVPEGPPDFGAGPFH